MKTWTAAVRAMQDKLRRVDRDIKMNFASYVISGTPVDTGEARGGWVATIDTPTSTYTKRLDPSAFQALSDLRQVATLTNAGRVMWLVNLAGHIVELEYGKSDQAPTGMVRVNIAAWQNIVQAAASKP